MSSWSAGRRPITIAVLAMGGEGGGVLADWIVAVGEAGGFTAQNTSVAGVAQRTGATVYYVELFPALSGDLGPGDGVDGRTEPILSVFPTPGEVDIVIASELMEAGRAIQRGFCTPDRTTLIASTSRVYAITERIALGDGIVDSAQLLAAAENAAKRFVGADFMALAEEAGSVVSASLFGALAGSGALPFERSAYEAAISASGKGVARSLAAFAAGYDAARPPRPAPVPITIGRRPVSPEDHRRELAVRDPGALVGPALQSVVGRVAAYPEDARSMVLHGVVRTAVWQDRAYAERYLDRLDRLALALIEPAARHVALWMCYQDTIHVALQKIRRQRLDGIRVEAKAEPGQLIQVREYLHPQLEEITDTLPTRLGRRLSRSRWFAWLVATLTRDGLVVNTTSVLGFTMLWVTASLRPLRPRSLRFGREQAAIDAWLDRAIALAAYDVPLAREVLECQGVLKGYGETHAHGRESFAALMAAADRLAGEPDAAAELARLRTAALADEDGTALALATR